MPKYQQPNTSAPYPVNLFGHASRHLAFDVTDCSTEPKYQLGDTLLIDTFDEIFFDPCAYDHSGDFLLWQDGVCRVRHLRILPTDLVIESNVGERLGDVGQFRGAGLVWYLDDFIGCHVGAPGRGDKRIKVVGRVCGAYRDGGL